MKKTKGREDWLYFLFPFFLFCFFLLTQFVAKLNVLAREMTHQQPEVQKFFLSLLFL